MSDSAAGERDDRIPQEFRRQVTAAPTAAELDLLGEEIRSLGFPWAAAGLRLVEQARRDRPPPSATGLWHTVLFTGHRIDAPDRREPRFPAAAEGEASAMIHGAVVELAEAGPRRLLGLAGGASGGDILFHEICGSLSVATELLLAFGRDEYVEASVADSGDRWVERFDRLRVERTVRQLQAAKELPRWLRGKGGARRYSVWERANRWMLHHALRLGAGATTLIALWDGRAGDGPGGTRDLLDRANARGCATVVLDATVLRRFAGHGGAPG